MARLMQFVPLLAEVEQPIIECFRNGGGVPYSQYPRFQQLMAEDSAAVHDASLVSTILPLVDGLTDRLERGIDVLDVGCGQGHAVNVLAKAFPNSRVHGLRLLARGNRRRPSRSRVDRTHERDPRGPGRHRHRRDERAYDLITAFDAIHDQAQPRNVLAGIAKALRPSGAFLMVDIKASSNLEENLDIPWAPFLYTASTMHCMTVSLALDGEGLGTAWGRQKACELLAEAGFTSVDVKEIDGDMFNYYFVAARRLTRSKSLWIGCDPLARRGSTDLISRRTRPEPFDAIASPHNTPDGRISSSSSRSCSWRAITAPRSTRRRLANQSLHVLSFL